MRKILKVVKHNHATFISLIALLGVSFVLVNQNTLINDYEHALKSLRHYDVLVDLMITNMDFSEKVVPILQIGDPDPTFNNDTTLHDWLYTFQNDALGINASFRFVYLRISIPEGAYSHFKQIHNTWFIEDNTGVLRKDTFSDSEYRYGYFDAIYDISRFMWKEDVPNQIKVETQLIA